MSTLNGQWLDIFRAGDYGDKGAYTVPDLAALASSYDPGQHEAPICIGHPETDAPAFGWVKQLRMDGDVLQALPHDVTPELDELVGAKKYKKRSVAFTRQSDGTLQLRHLGFLGATPPHVKGLRDAKFGSTQYEAIDFSEGEEMDQNQKMTFSEWLKALLGGEKSTIVSPSFSQDQIDAAINKAVAASDAKFADQLKTEREARQEVEKQLAEHTKTFSASTADARVAALIGGLKASKRWVPAYDAMGVPQLFASLASGAAVEIEFGEGDKKKKVDAVQLFADILHGIGQIVPEGRVFSQPASEGSATVPNVGGEVDRSSVAFDQQVKKFAADNKVDYTTAYREVVRLGGKREQSSAGAI